MVREDNPVFFVTLPVQVGKVNDTHLDGRGSSPAALLY